MVMNYLAMNLANVLRLSPFALITASSIFCDPSFLMVQVFESTIRLPFRGQYSVCVCSMTAVFFAIATLITL